MHGIIRVIGGLALNVKNTVAGIAFALAASTCMAGAQYFPPQPPPAGSAPPGYVGSPAPYGDPQQSYSSSQLPPAGGGGGAGGPPPVPSGYAPYRGPNGAPPYDPGYDQPVPVQGAEAYPPARPPYFSSEEGYAPQPLPALGGEPALRPPGEIGQTGPAPEVTGTVPPGPRTEPNRASIIASLPPEEQPEQGPPKELPAQFRRQLVDYVAREPAGTIIIDTPNTYLYLVLGNGKAMRYGIGVGREGFTWTGVERISRMKEWPDWFPPKEMIERQPYLPRFMAGGEGNPLGARALYLGATLYRIHGTNQPSTIGTFVSSGCIRLTNNDISDLYGRVSVGTRVVVLPGTGAPATASSHHPVTR